MRQAAEPELTISLKRKNNFTFQKSAQKISPAFHRSFQVFNPVFNSRLKTKIALFRMISTFYEKPETNFSTRLDFSNFSEMFVTAV